MQHESRNAQTAHSPVSAAMSNHSSSGISHPAVQAPLKPNETGLPDNLKTGIEHLSGFSMDDVKVHYNSSAPAQLQALAYAQGTNIHLGPGQERHLPHEAWHVVQQKQARVNATRQFREETAINDDVSLEHEADVMGAKALQIKSTEQPGTLNDTPALNDSQAPVQRKVGFEIEVMGKLMYVDKDDLSDSDDESENETKDSRSALSKGEVLHQGNGWKLTPEGGDKGLWTPEYIIGAIDETQNPEQIPVTTGAVAAHAQRNLEFPATWTNGANLKIEDDRRYPEVLGSFHVTGGLRLSRISQLIKTLNPPDSRAGQVASRAEAISFSGSNYKSVVALVALQISDLVKGEKPRAQEDSAKLYVGMLSRTDLGQVVARATQRTRKQTFINEVLAAAGVAGDAKLFSHRLPGSGDRNRSIDDQQDLTARQWLEKLLTGTDFKWSETKDDSGGNFGFEEVGESTLGHRAEGVILELRSLEEQEHQGLPIDKWVDVANRYKTLFALLNRKASEGDVKRGFGDYSSKYFPQE